MASVHFTDYLSTAQFSHSPWGQLRHYADWYWSCGRQANADNQELPANPGSRSFSLCERVSVLLILPPIVLLVIKIISRYQYHQERRAAQSLQACIRANFAVKKRKKITVIQTLQACIRAEFAVKERCKKITAIQSLQACIRANVASKELSKNIAIQSLQACIRAYLCVPKSKAEDILASREKVKDWLDKYRTDYVAHAVWKTNVASVLQSMSISPAEAVLRQKREVEYEKGSGYDCRGKENLNIDENKLKEAETLPPQWGYKAETFLYSLALSHIQSTHYQYFSSAFSQWNDFFQEHNIGDPILFYIALDERRPSENRIDVQLAKLYKEMVVSRIKTKSLVWKEEKENDPSDIDVRLIEKEAQQTAYEFCMKARQCGIPSSKLNCDIRVMQNAIAWSYGNVVVLRGDGKEVIGGCWSREGEAFLLAPFQNEGKFFSLDLTDPKILILAPLKIIQNFPNTAAKCNMVALEHLNPQQRLDFSVPSWDPKPESWS